MKKGIKVVFFVIFCAAMILLLKTNVYNASRISITIPRDSNGVYKITPHSIDISWNSVPTASYYKVEVSDGAGFDFVSESTSSSTYSITGLSSSTFYKITVRAFNENNSLIDENFVYVLTEFTLSANPKEEFPVPQGSGGEHPQLEIGFDKIKNNFSEDFEFKGYNVFVSKKVDKSDANQYFVDATSLKLYKYQLINDQKVLIDLVKDSVYQNAYENNGYIDFTLYDQYDGIPSKELKPGTMYYIYMEPNIERYTNITYYYKPVSNKPCPTLIQISAAKVAEVENDMGVLGALVRVQWVGVDPGEYKQDEIQYRAYYVTNEGDLSPWDNWPPNAMFATTSYLQNEAFIPWLSTNVDYYYIRVEAIFADGQMRIPSQLIKISVKELASLPSVIQNCQATPKSTTQIEISFKKPLQDDSALVYQIWYSDKYQDSLNEYGNPTVYNLVYKGDYDPNYGGLQGTDFELENGTTYKYTLSGLKPNTVYYFKIRVVNPQTEQKSDFSLVFVGTTLTEKSIIVPPVETAYFQTDEKTITATLTQVDLSTIEQVVYGVYYQVYLSEANWDVGSFKYLFEVSGAELSQNQNKITINADANGQQLKSNTSYYIRFKVRANIGGVDYLSEFSKAFAVLTKPSGITLPEKSRPEIPRNFMVSDEDGALTQTSVKLKWDVKQNHSYVIMRTLKPIDDIKLTVDEMVYYVVYTLKQKVEIYVRDQSGNFVLTQTLSNPANPNAVVYATIYKGVTSPFLDKNLTPNTLYYYSIKAIEDSQESFWGSMAVTTQPIEKPYNLVVLSRLSDGHGVVLQWFGNPDFGYQIFVQKDGDSSFSLVFSGKLTPTTTVSSTKAQFTYVVTGLSSNSLYYFKVRSIHISSGKVSSPSDIVAARTLFNQADFDEQQRQQKVQEEENIKIIQQQKQPIVVLENSYDRYYLMINDQNALDEIEKSGQSEFVIDFTKAQYSSAKGQVMFSYRVADRLQIQKKDLVIKYYNAIIRIPPGALDVDEVTKIAQKYSIDKGYVTIFIEVGNMNSPYAPWGYTLDSTPLSFKASARFYYIDEQGISQFLKPITYVLRFNTPIVAAKTTKVVYDYNNYREVDGSWVDTTSNQMFFNLQTTGTFGVLTKSISSTLDTSKYRDDIVYISKKYNITDLYDNPLKPLTADYAKSLIKNIFKVDINANFSSALKRQEAIYLIAKTYEAKKNASVDDVLITKSSRFEPDPIYKKYVLSMLSLGVVDMDEDPSKTIDVDEFVHYLVNLEKVLNY